MTQATPIALLTGFPGFIAERLLPRLIDLHPETEFLCLVQPRFKEQAQAALTQLAIPAVRAGLIEGDITLEGLGIESSRRAAILPRLDAVFHLAAVYDLAVTADFAYRVNVLGTRNVIGLARLVPGFSRLHHISTAYVSGTFEGVFKETDLDLGQAFKNHYESTKFESEKDVVKSGLPFTVYRPGVVWGDSRTGETAKFDGPYSVMGAMEKVPLIFLDGPKDATMNVVPVDYVIEGLARLSASPLGLGKTYNLTDPDGKDVRTLTRLMAKALGRSYLFVPLPLWLVGAAVSIPFVGSTLGLIPESIAYFGHRCRYDASQAKTDLETLGLSCPPVETYIDNIVRFFRSNRDRVRKTAMV
ncbi:MAG: SDR family oxidoreductase [Vicinamibacteria bacterium]|nr:SDR family oxidoreductase [Vicinamibacteria bacterium]